MSPGKDPLKGTLVETCAGLLIEKSFELLGHAFHMTLIRATNGAILLIYEGSEPTLGSLTATVKTPVGIHSLDITPGRKGDILSKVLSEMLANQIHGFVISSFYSHRMLEPEVLSQLVQRVRTLLSETP